MYANLRSHTFTFTYARTRPRTPAHALARTRTHSHLSNDTLIELDLHFSSRAIRLRSQPSRSWRRQLQTHLTGMHSIYLETFSGEERAAQEECEATLLGSGRISHVSDALHVRAAVVKVELQNV
eukprot:6180909-Pleurochrysis_carterae.AAC.1